MTGRQLREEWFGAPPHLWSIARPKPDGQRTAPRDFRPADIDRGRLVMSGLFTFDGLELELAEDGDLWNRATPSRAFAAQLHRMDWLRDLMAAGEAGPRTALGHVLAWQAVFGRWNSFAWGPLAITRRVFNLAANLKRLSSAASESETAVLQFSLARQARHLLMLQDGPRWAAERCAAAAVAGAALAGKAGDKILARALKRLEPALKAAVLPDGGHASRSPEAGLELLLDLLSLDDALLQLGRPPPPELTRAIDRLTAGLSFFTLSDGRLASFQGGEQSTAERVIAAAACGEADASPEGEDGSLAPPPSPSAPFSGYEKLIGRQLVAIIDAAPPARGAWSPTACAQALALEILAGPDRLITNSGWSVRAEGNQALRLTPAGSTLTLTEASAGAPIGGLRARVLGSRLEGGASSVDLRRHDAETGAWLELSHDAWVPVFGLVHDRRLYMDCVADELRGEDRVRPHSETATGRRIAQFAVRFHLQPGVRASVAMDQRSILLWGPSHDGWWLRSDASEVTLEPSLHLQGGRPRRTTQVVLRSLLRTDRTGRIRWKFTAADSRHSGH